MIVRVGRMTPYLMEKCGEYFPDKNSGGKLTVDKFARICERLGVALNVMHLKELYTKAAEKGGSLTYEEFCWSMFPEDGDEEIQDCSTSTKKNSRIGQGDDVTETETETAATPVGDPVEETEEDVEKKEDLNFTDISVSDMVIACREYFSAKNSNNFIFSTPFSKFINEGGKFDLLEFQWMSECIGLTLAEKQTDILDNIAEENGDGKISITDFVETFPKLEKKVAKSSRKKKKQRSAKRTKTFTSVDEVKMELVKRCREFYQAMNINENDFLTQEEFMNLCKHVAMVFDAEQLTTLHAKVEETSDGKIIFRGFLFVGEKEWTEVRKSGCFTTNSVGDVLTNDLNSINVSAQGTSKSPEQQIKTYKDYFRQMDVNGDGKLNKEEFIKMSQHVGLKLHAEQLKKIYAKADETGDGLITFREFLAAFSGEKDNAQLKRKQSAVPNHTKSNENNRSSDQMKKYREYFREMDVNGDGILSKEEFLRMSQTIGLQLDNEQLKKVYAKADETGDGHVTFREFLTAFSGEKCNAKAQRKPSAIPNQNAFQDDKSNPQDQMKIYREYFREMDANGDGKLSKEEFLKMSQTIGLPLDQEQLKRVYAKADETGDGQVTFREFLFAFSGEPRGRKTSALPSGKVQDRAKRSSLRMSNKDSLLHGHGRKISVTFYNTDVEPDSNRDVTKKRSNDMSKTQDQTKVCREYFAAMDINGDGKLSQGEFLQMSKKIGLHLDCEQLKRVYAKADETGDGEITFREFMAAFGGGDSAKIKNGNTLLHNKKCIASHSVASTELPDIAEEDGRIQSACKYFWNNDIDCDGRLDSAEFSRMLDMLGMKLSRRDVTKAFKVADSAGSGFVTFTNFVDVYLSATGVGPFLSREKIKEVFRLLDVEGKMFLDSEQFMMALRKLGKKADSMTSKRLMGHAATSDRNRVYFPEFCSFFGAK